MVYRIFLTRKILVTTRLRRGAAASRRKLSLENFPRLSYDCLAAQRALCILTSCDIGRAALANASVTAIHKCVGSRGIIAYYTHLGVRDNEAIK